MLYSRYINRYSITGFDQIAHEQKLASCILRKTVTHII